MSKSDQRTASSSWPVRVGTDTALVFTWIRSPDPNLALPMSPAIGRPRRSEARLLAAGAHVALRTRSRGG